MRAIASFLSFAFLAIFTVTILPGSVEALNTYIRGCANDISKSFAYCDESLTLEERARSLVNELSLIEKINLIGPDTSLGNPCDCHCAGVERVGLPEYMHLVETNTNVASRCVMREENKKDDKSKGKSKRGIHLKNLFSEKEQNGVKKKGSTCSTVLPGPLVLGATFNKTVWKLKGRMLSTEQRAFYNIDGQRTTLGDTRRPIGLSAYGPNLNILRDPRFGRNSELNSEDPYLSGIYGKEMIEGMMEKDEHGHVRILGFLKHFDAYSLEQDRGHSDIKISEFDLADTYLRQYEIASQAKPAGAMCSYNAVNGVPMCANDKFLNGLFRRRWNNPDAIISSDCGAISNLRGLPLSVPTDVKVAAVAFNNGTDLEMGSTLYRENMHDAVKKGLVSERTINKSVLRIVNSWFKAGRFSSKTGFDDLDEQHINTEEHRRFAADGALQGTVLLKNRKSTLPLKKGLKIALIGPFVNYSEGMHSSYCSDQVCPDGTWNCFPTFTKVFEEVNQGGAVTSAEGVDVNSDDASRIQQAVDTVAQSEVVVLALGSDPTLEHEGVDKTTTELTGKQVELFKQVVKEAKRSRPSKPIILLMVNGGALAIDTLIADCDAILETFTPNKGAKEVAELIFGDHNRFGRLPYTMYPASWAKEQLITSFDMTKPPGRTYRYYAGKSLFEFGFGLSYTTFEQRSHSKINLQTSEIEITSSIKNTGNRAGDEVVMIYHAVSQRLKEKIIKTYGHPVPLKKLIEFERVRIESGESKKLTFKINIEESFHLIDSLGQRKLYHGEHCLRIKGSSTEEIKCFNI